MGGVYDPNNSPVKTELSKIRAQPSLLEQMPEEEWEGDDVSFRRIGEGEDGEKEQVKVKQIVVPVGVNGEKENQVPVPVPVSIPLA